MPLDAEVSVPFDKVLWLDDGADDAFPQSDLLCYARENEGRALMGETVAEAVARMTIDAVMLLTPSRLVVPIIAGHTGRPGNDLFPGFDM